MTSAADLAPRPPKSVPPADRNRGRLLLGILISCLAVLGFATVRDYGKSWDEYVHEAYARQTIEIYEGIRAPEDTLFNLRYYGPFFSVLVSASEGPLSRLVDQWIRADARHFVYYMSFLGGIVSLYALCRRYTGTFPALASSLLFASQPVLYGHAFMNPKDIPFMSAFLASLVTGLYAAEGFGQSAGPIGIREVARQSWRSARPWQRLGLGIGAALIVVAAAELLRYHSLLRVLQDGLASAYSGRAWPPLQSAFDLIAQDAFKTPLIDYADKLRRAYMLVRWPALVGLASIGIGFLHAIFSDQVFGPWWRLFVAGVLVGLTLAIRIQGLFAGLLICLAVSLHARKRSLAPLALYGSVAALVTYVAWPFLWGDPVGRFLEALSVMRSFGWGGEVLYEGAIYRSNLLPWHYAPKLIVLQVTIPALLLSLAGTWLSLRRIRRPTRLILEIPLLLLWLVGPVAYASLPGVDTYDNFRQLLFALPPLFVLAAVAFERAITSIKPAWIAAGLVALSVAPGVLGIVKLHPYEYVYYNALAGGTRGAYRRFELDYWCTSSKEAMELLNDLAPQGSTIAINKDSDQLVPYVRPDLTIVPNIHTTERAKRVAPDYLVICNRADLATTLLPGREVVGEVYAADVPLITIKKGR